MSRKNKKRVSSKNSKRTLLVSLAAVAVVVICGGAAYAWHNHNSQQATQTADTTSGSNKQKIDMSPATPTDKAEGDAAKSAIVEEQNNPTPAKPAATPVIDFAGFNDPPTNSQPEVDAHIEGVVETGGTCTLTATLGSRSFTKTVTGVRNAQNTSCPAFILGRSDFTASGDWTIKVSYSSAAYSGVSQPQTMRIP